MKPEEAQKGKTGKEKGGQKKKKIKLQIAT